MDKVELQKALRDALDNTFFQLEQLNELTFEAKGKGIDEVAPDGTVKQRIIRIIRTAQTELWMGDLIRAAQTLRNAEPRFAILLAHLQPTPFLAGIDHYEAHWLDSGLSRAMLNRTALRKALRQLDDPLSGMRILVVDGDPSTGKSYSRDFIEYLQLTLQTFTVAAIDLLQAGVSEVLAGHLAWQLADRFGVTELPARDNEQGGTWVSRVANRLALALKAQKIDDDKAQWIVIDGFNKVTVAEETRDLVAQVAWRVAQELTNVRLVLLSYRRASLPSAIEEHVAEEIINIKLDSIECELKPFFARLYDQRVMTEVGFKYTAEDLDESVASVVSELEREGPRTLRTLSAALGKVARERELLR